MEYVLCPCLLNLVHNAIQRRLLGDDSSRQLSLKPITGDAVYPDAQEEIGISIGTLLVWYFVVIIASAFRVYSFNVLMAEFIQDPLHGYLFAITLAFFGMVFYSHNAQGSEFGYVSTTKAPGSVYLLILPHFAMCNPISTVYYSSERKRVCEDPEIRVILNALEESILQPNCCRNFAQLYEHKVLHNNDESRFSQRE
uniref:Uncharacterized protein n=1 Tax=Glossina austeni TaxID=7395 RepID=A0A1A9UDQ2_GLOAU